MSAQILKQRDSRRPTSSHANSRPGFFAGAGQVDASHGVFTDIAGDLYISAQDDDLLLLDKLPHATGAGYQSGNHETCLRDTRRAELQRIEDWEEDYTNRRVYWLNGMAGTGKSTIAQTFAERSFAKARLGASFFCSREFDERRNINFIFPTLAYHLAFRYPEFKAALIPIIRSRPDPGNESLAAQLENFLVKPLQTTGLSTTIIIDALDECNDKQPASAILSLLGQHIHAIPSVKFFITGRPEIPIRSGFRLPLLQPHTEVFLLHEVDRTSVDQDIELCLRSHLSRIVAERSDCDVTVPWPSDAEVAAAVKKSSGLFIVASVIIKIVEDHYHDPTEQLQAITSRPNSTLYEGTSGVDEIYSQVFIQSFEDVNVARDIDFFDRLRLVVGAIALAFNPLSCADLVKILDIPRGRVRSTLRSLHSVIMVPNSDMQPFRVFHKSFVDFLTDASRCTDSRFHVDPTVYHFKIATCCLKLITKLLRRNICDLPPYVMNKNVGGLAEGREKHIGGGLEYACKSWARHLRFSSRSGDDIKPVVELLDHFFRHKLLSWLEVLSIVGDLHCAVYSLHDVISWLIGVGLPNADLLSIIKDSERFVLRFFDAIEASASHIYHSALPWSPATSLVRMLYQDQISTGVRLLNAVDTSWDACTRIIQTRNRTECMAFSNEAGLVAVGEPDGVEIFEVATGKCRIALTEAQRSNTLSFSPDDALLVTGCFGGRVCVWDLQTGGLVSALEGHTGHVCSVAFSPCGTMIASCSWDHTIRIWNVSSYDCRCVLRGHSDYVGSVCWSTTGHRVISGSLDRTVRVWDITEEKCLTTVTGHIGQLWSVTCSPDSSFIAYGPDRTISIFDIRTGVVRQTISANGNVGFVRFLTQDQLMYGTIDSTFVIWDLTKNASVLTFKYDGYGAVASGDGTRIASRQVKAVKIWQADSTGGNRDITYHHSRKVNCVAFSGDGRLVVSGSEDITVKLWDATTGLCLETFQGLSGRVDSVAFSPDSTLCVSGTRDLFDSTLRIWDVNARRLRSTIRGVGLFSTYSIRFSPDSSQLLSLVRSHSARNPCLRLTLWEVATRKRLAEVEVDDSYTDVAFGVDGSSVILTGGASVNRWRISSTSMFSRVSSSMPMVFVPIPDNERSAPPDAALHHYHYEKGSEWILDEQNRRVLWIPPDQRGDGASDFNGKKVVLGSLRGKVTIVDFSDS